MNYGYFFVLIFAGLLGMSSMIAAKRPDSQAVFDRLMPFQGFFGIIAMTFGLIYFVSLHPTVLIKSLRGNAFQTMLTLTQCAVGIVLGFLFAIPLLAKLGGNPQRGQALAASTAPWTTLLGMVAAGAGAIGLLYALGIAQKIESFV
jgi:hypothetical protein